MVRAAFDARSRHLSISKLRDTSGARGEISLEGKLTSRISRLWAKRPGGFIDAVTLNPERDAVVKMAAGAQHTQPMAA